MLSTGVMIRTGAVFSNLMVNVRPTNVPSSLDRAQLISPRRRPVSRIHPLDQPAAAKLLTEAAGSVKTDIVMPRLHLARAAAEMPATAHGRLSTALQQRHDPSISAALQPNWRSESAFVPSF